MSNDDEYVDFELSITVRNQENIKKARKYLLISWK